MCPKWWPSLYQNIRIRRFSYPGPCIGTYTNCFYWYHVLKAVLYYYHITDNTKKSNASIQGLSHSGWNYPWPPWFRRPGAMVMISFMYSSLKHFDYSSLTIISCSHFSCISFICQNNNDQVVFTKWTQSLPSSARVIRSKYSLNNFFLRTFLTAEVFLNHSGFLDHIHIW
jgi:hypothetical protein